MPASLAGPALVLRHVVAGGGRRVESPWRWHPHPEVWMIVVAAAVLYWLAVTRLGPILGQPGQPSVTSRQVACFGAALVLLEIGADWPVHDLAEGYLYSVHMAQHMLFTLVVPPLLLLGTPGWLQRWLLRPRWAAWAGANLTRPFVAAAVYNVLVVATHWPPVVNASLRSEPMHFGLHLLIFSSAMFMWFPVLNRLPGLPRMSRPTAMMYLFLQSVIPTVPASFLTFATTPIYSFYATVPHPFGIDVIQDQQVAAAIMKVVGGLYLWGVIFVMFMRWYQESEGVSRARRAGAVLTWDDVARELERTPAPPG